MKPLRLIPVKEADLGTLRDIGIETFSEAFAQVNNPDDFQKYLDKAFNKEQLHREFHTPGTLFFFLYANDVLAGYSKINTGSAQSELQEEEGMEIERIYIRKPYQSKGLGAWMLRSFAEMAQSEGKTYLWLGVWEENHKAIRFYEQQGFVTFDKHPYYVGEDRQMDWMMRLDLSHLAKGN